MSHYKILKFNLLILIIIMILSIPVISKELVPISNIVNLQGSPIKILSYETEYAEESKYSSAGIAHRVKLQNISNQEIVAYEMLFVSFNVFNEFINKVGGVSISSTKPNEEWKCGWRSHAYGDFAFLTGIAFVEKVRFIDGKIWEADHELIIAELKKIEKNFDASVLKEKEKVEK